MKNSLDIILAYHQRTKHHLNRYAAGPSGLDWKNQPDPFRNFTSSPQLELHLLADEPHRTYTDLYKTDETTREPLTLSGIAALLELSFGISAWKQYDGPRWALRCNPSSGNLHPTEAYVITEGCSGIVNGVHHYVSRDHVLEQRCRFDMAVSGSEPSLPPRFLSRGPVIDPLARSMEIWRTRIPVLPARCGSCHRGRPLCIRSTGLAGACAEFME